jgi:gas vesicle protein
MTRQQGTRLMFFVAGITTGAAIGMLAAPRSGAEMRRKLASSADVGRDFLDKTRHLYEQGRRLAEEAAEVFDEGRKLVRG